MTPSYYGGVSTYTNATVQITPNMSSMSVTETVTATVTTTSPLPPGVGTPIGTVLFNLNNQQQSATLNSNGQATATFHLPLMALLAGEELTASYQGYPSFTFGAPPVPGHSQGFAASTFDAPLYMNTMNVFLPATLTFGQLTSQQLTGNSNPSILPFSFNTAQGESDNFGLVSLQYVDPGVLIAVTPSGVALPGIFASALAVYYNNLSPQNPVAPLPGPRFLQSLAYTYTDAAVLVMPNADSMSVTEMVIATVKTVPYDPLGQPQPIPAGAGTPVGTVAFNLNNLHLSASLNGNGQAIAAFTLPLQALSTSQTFRVLYSDPNEYYIGSQFEAPLYLSFNNLSLPALLTFGQLSPQQVTGYDSRGNYTSLPSYNTAQEETDNFGVFAFHYVDPGIISSMTIASMT